MLNVQPCNWAEVKVKYGVRYSFRPLKEGIK